MNESNFRLTRLVKLGADMATETAAAAATAWLTGGANTPEASALSAAIATPVKAVLNDVANRLLSPGEERRVGGAVVQLVVRIQEQLAAGARPRNDGFFEARLDDRAAAAELLEATLLKCRDEAQEKKCAFVSNIFVSAAFRADLSLETLIYLLNRAEGLTYRQLCLVAMVSRGYPLSRSWGRIDPSGSHPDRALIAEVTDIARDWVHAIGNTELAPQLLPLGKSLYETMKLDAIPEAELTALSARLFREAMS